MENKSVFYVDLSPKDIRIMILHITHITLHSFLCITIKGWSNHKDALFFVSLFWKVMLHNTLDACRSVLSYIRSNTCKIKHSLNLLVLKKKYKKPFYLTSALQWQTCVVIDGIDSLFYFWDQCIGNSSPWIDRRPSYTGPQ